MDLIDKIKTLVRDIEEDAFPNGLSGTCSICGKPFSYTKEECVYYLAHGWPKCKHEEKEDG